MTRHGIGWGMITAAVACAPASPERASEPRRVDPAVSASAETAQATTSDAAPSPPQPGRWRRLSRAEGTVAICGEPEVRGTIVEEAWALDAFFTSVRVMRLSASAGTVGAAMAPIEVEEMVSRWREQIGVVPWPSGGSWKAWQRRTEQEGNVTTRIELLHSSGPRWLYCEYNG